MAASDIITYSQPSTGHGFFKCTLRTAAHLDYTKARLKEEHPFAVLVIIQGCYHTGVGVSAGTHDYDACLDVRILNMTWLDAQAFLRECGWGAWVRWPWQGFDEHIHMISLGFDRYDIKVGKYVDGGVSLFGSKVTSSQVEDYYNHAYGLSGLHTPGSDKTWFPSDINATIFDFEAWEQELEDSMPWSNWPQSEKDEMLDAIEARVKKVVTNALKSLPTKVWAFVVRTSDKATARAALRRAAFGDEE